MVDADRRGRSRGAVLQRHHEVRRLRRRSRTPTWRNSKIIGPYDPDAIRRLKDEVDGDLYVSGSGTLVRAMLADGLIDELHLFVYPAHPRGGPAAVPRRRRAGEASSLAACESYDNGVVYLAYRPRPDGGARPLRPGPTDRAERMRTPASAGRCWTLLLNTIVVAAPARNGPGRRSVASPADCTQPVATVRQPGPRST